MKFKQFFGVLLVLMVGISSLPVQASDSKQSGFVISKPIMVVAVLALMASCFGCFRLGYTVSENNHVQEGPVARAQRDLLIAAELNLEESNRDLGIANRRLVAIERDFVAATAKERDLVAATKEVVAAALNQANQEVEKRENEIRQEAKERENEIRQRAELRENEIRQEAEGREFGMRQELVRQKATIGQQEQLQLKFAIQESKQIEQLQEQEKQLREWRPLAWILNFLGKRPVMVQLEDGKPVASIYKGQEAGAPGDPHSGCWERISEVVAK